jgi:radical SAM superfamily enzyme YgiQ (UPF0313 family)
MDSAAGGRFQATYNATGDYSSHWIPLWVCYAASSVLTARSLDCNIEGISREQFIKKAPDYDIFVFYSNQETIDYDIQTAKDLKFNRPRALIAFAGPFATVRPDLILNHLPEAIVLRGEIEPQLQAIAAGGDHRQVEGIAWQGSGGAQLNGEPTLLEDLDSLPWVSKTIRRDLPLLKYRIPYLYHPYISIFTGRGCNRGCVFCLWPQTISGRRYRKRSIRDVASEMRWIKGAMPEIKEIQIEDDTFTDDPARVLEFCDLIRGSGITWSCCARQDASGEILPAMKNAGARNLVVGFESGDNDILRASKKGVNVRQGYDFVEKCRSADLSVHGCFVFGLPGETEQTMEKTLEYAKELSPDTIQFTIACAYEGAEFYDYLKRMGYLNQSRGITPDGHISARYDYPLLSSDRINEFTQDAWTRYYLRPGPIAGQLKRAISDRNEAKKLLYGAKYLGDYFFMKAPHNGSNKPC